MGEDGLSRRRAIVVGAGLAGTAWVAPTVLSFDAASAASAPPDVPASLSGNVRLCGSPLNPGEQFEVIASGPGSGSGFTDGAGDYAIFGLAAGSYTITLHPSGTNAGQPDQVILGVVVPAIFEDFDYIQNGCN